MRKIFLIVGLMMNLIASAQWQSFGSKSDVFRVGIGAIKTGVSDIYGNVYISGSFTNSNDRAFVAKWNGMNG